jgi:hypothetical protein
MGRVGCGTVCQARVAEAGVRDARGDRVCGRAVEVGSGMISQIEVSLRLEEGVAEAET